MTKEALQIALNALTDFDYDKRIKAIEIIKEALETKDKPVSCAECGASGGHALYCVACAEKFVNTEAVLVEEMQRMAKRIEDLEAMLERQTARIVELQEHIENFDGEDR